VQKHLYLIKKGKDLRQEKYGTTIIMVG